MSINSNQDDIIAIRGTLLSYQDDPFKKPINECLVYESDGLILIKSGKIAAVGTASEILKKLPVGTKIIEYKNALITPGLIDCHVHYPQTQIIGAYGKQLIDWLSKYTFVAEQNFNDKVHASEVAKVFARGDPLWYHYIRFFVLLIGVS